MNGVVTLTEAKSRFSEIINRIISKLDDSNIDEMVNFIYESREKEKSREVNL